MKDDKFLLILLLILGIISLLILKPFITYILFSIMLVVVTYPLYEKVTGKFKSRVVSAIIVIALIIALVIVPAIYIAISIFNETRDMIVWLGSAELSVFQTIDDSVLDYFGVKLNFVDNLQIWIADFSTVIRSYILGNVVNFTKAIANFIGGIVLMFFIMFYLFVDGKSIVQEMKRNIPLHDKYKNHLLNRTYLTIHGLFLGSFLTALIQGFIGAIGFSIFGIPNAMFWGFSIGVFSLLPLLGPPVIYIPAGLVLLLQGDLFNGAGLILYGIFIVSNVDNFVRPRVVNINLKIHPLAVILGVVGGVSLIGFSGIVIGPLVMALFIDVLHTYHLARKKRG